MPKCKNCDQPIENIDHDTNLLCDPCATLCERTPPIQITPIEPGDLELVMAWRSNPRIYRYFRNQDNPLDWENHLSWYESRPTNCHDFIIHYEGRRVGVVSISSDDDITIYLGDFYSHGQGVAKATLRWICERFDDRTPLSAEIHDENTTSKRLFEKCGFEQYGRNGEWKQYKYATDS